MKIRLQRVHLLPKDLETGVLYVSEEFNIAVHLCPCGCGSKIRTPLGPTEWSFKETPSGPTLHPSVGNWQQACKSHYWITQGKVNWSNQWTTEQIEAGRSAEEARRKAYYEEMYSQNNSPLARIWKWIKELFKR